MYMSPFTRNMMHNNNLFYILPSGQFLPKNSKCHEAKCHMPENECSVLEGKCSQYITSDDDLFRRLEGSFTAVAVKSALLLFCSMGRMSAEGGM